ncbi:MAG: PHP domain-containing protein [Halobacteriales archaeon]|nr:PHP domain-containing protein [Halobacteriales archaeon]
MLKADLHIHSEASYDCESSVDEILESAVEESLDVVAVTDHDEIHASHEAVESAPEYDLTAVPGIEVSTADGHLLALGVEEKIPAGEPVERTIEKVRERGGVAIIPHPFQRMRHGVGAVRDCDAVETYNSRLLTGIANRRARRFARANDLPEVGGSDAHIPAMVGQTYTEIDAEADADAVLKAIRDGRTEVHGRRTPLLHTAQQFAARVPGRVKHDLLSLFS